MSTSNTAGGIIATSLIAGGTVAGVIALGLGTSWFGLVTHRPMAKYAEETRREVFETSRAHQSGVNMAISSDCLNMRREKDAASKAALARFIVSEASTFEGALTPDAAACLSEANSALDAPLQ